MNENKNQFNTSPKKEKFDFFSFNTIKNEENFWDVYVDAKNQLGSPENIAKSENSTEEEFKEFFNEIKYIHFLDYLKESHITLPPEYLANKSVGTLIQAYDLIVDKLKNVTSKQSFMEVMPDINNIPTKHFNLGIDIKDND